MYKHEGCGGNLSSVKGRTRNPELRCDKCGSSVILGDLNTQPSSADLRLEKDREAFRDQLESDPGQLHIRISGRRYATRPRKS